MLLPNGRIDCERTKELVDIASPLDVTFHRAFDVCRDPFEALIDLVEIGGIQRILSSGQEGSVLEGIPLLNQLLSKIENEKLTIAIMPGCGINERNMKRILKELHPNVKEIHMALPKLEESLMKHRTDRVFMGVQLSSSEYLKSVTSGELVKNVKS